MSYAYADETASRKIVCAIVAERKRKVIETTFDLVAVIETVLPKKAWMRTNPATKTFQALRIAVNDEHGAVKEVLAKGFEKLKPAGRSGQSSVSIVERDIALLKTSFGIRRMQSLRLLITKKPITPTDEELADNPRARSAQLRVLEKTTPAA
jgi:16S rRNA (cytosine1402-N4)-methyltransferase